MSEVHNNKDLAGRLRAEDIESGYPEFHAGFEAGVNFAYREMASVSQKYYPNEPSLLTELVRTVLEWIGVVGPGGAAYDYEDTDGEDGFAAWRLVHEECLSSKAAADQWARTDLYIWGRQKQ